MIDLKESMRKLSIEQGGIFPEIKRSLASGTSYLIVSFGGTGGDALEVIKEKLERYVDKVEQEKYVRLLAIDTDKTAKKKSVKVQDKTGAVREVEVDKFTDREFFWLDNVPARGAVDLYDRDPAMQQWMNPRLPAAIAADPRLLNGNGASGVRQCGRALLYPTETVNGLENRIRTLVKDITNGNHNNLKVIIISGISGGTGSGIVVDASYLIRDFITRMDGGVGGRTEYLGFLLLPPTGKSSKANDISKGNRNGIAALKEIDHFMTIAYRKEKYSAALGGKRFESENNIFDTCYLIDGVHTGYAVSNPREKANEVVSDCILDMLTSQIGGGPAGNTTASVDSFMSDASGAAKNMLMTTPEQRAPRNANYVYCAIGHGKVLIPLELMKAYVAKTVFDKIYASFEKCGSVDKDGAKKFVEEVKVRPYNQNNQQKAIREKVDELFADPKRGPFYTINLLCEASAYASQQANIIAGRTFQWGGDEKKRQYEYIRDYTNWLNKETFRVYTTVLEEMQRYLKEQHGILCDSKKLEAYGGSTYTFTPIDFGGNDTKAQTVKKYLDLLVSPKRVNEMANALLREMAGHRKEWTQLETKDPNARPGFDAATRIRKFWADEIGKIVSSTIEDYLLKYYSNNPDAKYEEIETNEGKRPTDQSIASMNEAAKAIVEQMWGGAGKATPLAELQTGILGDEKFNGHNLFLVPQSAPHLRDAIVAALAAQSINDVRVGESFADDRLSCYSQYTGIPAFMFAWTRRAEPDYETTLRGGFDGLHMSESKGGERWQDYPNLMVENIWGMFAPPYTNDREKAINRRVAESFEQARALGLTQKNALAALATVGQYTVYTLPEQFRPDVALFKNVDTELDGSQAKQQAEEELNRAVEEKAQLLFAKDNWAEKEIINKDGMKQAVETAVNEPDTFTPKVLNFTNTVMTPYTSGANPEPPAGWEEKLAAELLRTCPSYMFEVRGTVLVMKRLFELVSTAQAVKAQLKDFASFLVAGLFQYDSVMSEWLYDDELNQQQVLTMMKIGDAQHEAAQYYFMFEDYRNDHEAITAALKPRLAEKNPEPARGDSQEERLAKIELKRAFLNRANKLHEEVSKTLNDRTNPKPEMVLTTQRFRQMAQDRGYNVNAILKFYRDLQHQLELMS